MDNKFRKGGEDSNLLLSEGEVEYDLLSHL